MCRALRTLRSSRRTPINEIATMRSGPRSTSSCSPLRNLVLGFAVIACCTTRGKGFLLPIPPPGFSVSSSAGSVRRWCSAASRDSISSSSSSSSSNRRTLHSQSQDRRSHHSCWEGVGNGRG
ncbi:unnamed protein product, partial [Laminaria digitata]